MLTESGATSFRTRPSSDFIGKPIIRKEEPPHYHQCGSERSHKLPRHVERLFSSPLAGTGLMPWSSWTSAMTSVSSMFHAASGGSRAGSENSPPLFARSAPRNRSHTSFEHKRKDWSAVHDEERSQYEGRTACTPCTCSANGARRMLSHWKNAPQVGLESTWKRSFNNMRRSRWHLLQCFRWKNYERHGNGTGFYDGADRQLLRPKEVPRSPSHSRNDLLMRVWPRKRLLGRFLYLWSELDNLPAFFRGNPFHAFSEVIRYVELDCFCHRLPTFPSKISACCLRSHGRLSICMALPLPSTLTTHEIA